MTDTSELVNNQLINMIEITKDEKLLKQESEIQFLQFKFKLQHKQMSEIGKKIAITEIKKLEKELLVMTNLSDNRKIEIIELKSKQVISNLKEEELNIELKKLKDKFDLSIFKSKKLQEKIILLEKNKLIYDKDKEKYKEKEKNENKTFQYKHKITLLEKELINKSNIIKSLETELLSSIDNEKKNMIDFIKNRDKLIDITKQLEISKEDQKIKNLDISIYLKKIESITEEIDELRTIFKNKEHDIYIMHDQEIDEIIKKHEIDLNQALSTLTNLHTEVSSDCSSNVKILENELQNKQETINILQKKIDNILLENEELREINQNKKQEIQQQHENELEEIVEKYDQKIKDIEEYYLLIDKQHNNLIQDINNNNNNNSNNNDNNIESCRIKETDELDVSLKNKLNNSLLRQHQLESDIAVQFKYFSNKINEINEKQSKEIDLINNNHKEKSELYESNINLFNNNKELIEKLYKEREILEIQIENKSKELLIATDTIESLNKSTENLRNSLSNSHKQSESLILEAKKRNILEDELLKLNNDLVVSNKEKELLKQEYSLILISNQATYDEELKLKNNLIQVANDDLNRVLVTMAKLHEQIAEDNEGKHSLENIELISIKSKLLDSEKEKDNMYIEMDGLFKDIKSLQLKENLLLNEFNTLKKKLEVSDNEINLKVIEIKDYIKIINSKKDIESDLRAYIVELQDNQKVLIEEISLLKNQIQSSQSAIHNNIIEIDDLSKDLVFKKEIEIELRQSIFKLNEEIQQLSSSVVVLEDKLLGKRNDCTSLEKEIISSNCLIDTLKSKLLLEENNNNKNQIIMKNNDHDLNKMNDILNDKLTKAYEQSESLIILEAKKRTELESEILKLNEDLIVSKKEKELFKQEVLSLKSLLQEADKDYRTRIINLRELNEDIKLRKSVEIELRNSLVILEDRQKISDSDIDALKSKILHEESNKMTHITEIERLMKEINIKINNENNLEAALKILSEKEKQLLEEIHSLKTQLLSTDTHNKNRINSLIKDMNLAKEIETDLRQDFVKLQLQLKDEENKSSVIINSLEAKLKENFDSLTNLEKETSLSIPLIDSLKIKLLSSEKEKSAHEVQQKNSISEIESLKAKLLLNETTNNSRLIEIDSLLKESKRNEVNLEDKQKNSTIEIESLKLNILTNEIEIKNKDNEIILLKKNLNKEIDKEENLRETLVILEDKQKISDSDIDTLKSKILHEESNNMTHIIEIERLMKEINIKINNENNLEASVKILSEVNSAINIKLQELDSAKTSYTIKMTELNEEIKVRKDIEENLLKQQKNSISEIESLKAKLLLNETTNNSRLIEIDSLLKESKRNEVNLEDKQKNSTIEIESLKLNILTNEIEIKNKDNEIILLKKNLNKEIDKNNADNNFNVISKKNLTKYRSIHEFIAEKERELSIVQGELLEEYSDVIVHSNIDLNYEKWTMVRSLNILNGIYRTGYVPNNYIIELTDEVITEIFAKAESFEKKLFITKEEIISLNSQLLSAKTEITNNKSIYDEELQLKNNLIQVANDDLNKVLVTMAKLHEQVAEDNEVKHSLEIEIQNKINELLNANNIILNLESKLIDYNNVSLEKNNSKTNSFISSWKNKLSPLKTELINRDIEKDIKVHNDIEHELRKSLENLQNKQNKSIEEINSLKTQLLNMEQNSNILIIEIAQLKNDIKKKKEIELNLLQSLKIKEDQILMNDTKYEEEKKITNSLRNELSKVYEQSESLIILEAAKRTELESEILKLNEDSIRSKKKLHESLDYERTEKHLRTFSLLNESETSHKDKSDLSLELSILNSKLVDSTIQNKELETINKNLCVERDSYMYELLNILENENKIKSPIQSKTNNNFNTEIKSVDIINGYIKTNDELTYEIITLKEKLELSILNYNEIKLELNSVIEQKKQLSDAIDIASAVVNEANLAYQSNQETESNNFKYINELKNKLSVIEIENNYLKDLIIKYKNNNNV